MKIISAKQRDDGYYEIEITDNLQDGTPVVFRYPKAMINITVYAEDSCGNQLASFTLEE